MKKSWYYLIVLAVVVLALGIYYVSYSKQPSVTGFATSNSQLGNLSVGVQTYMACTWSAATLNVSFGTSLNPGTNDTNATANYNQAGEGSGYNVTVDSLSTSAANITILGNDLCSGANLIEVGNVTYQSNSTNLSGDNMVPSGSTAITDSAVVMIQDEPIDSTAWYRLWLDIPIDTVAGDYVGNYTLQCEEA